MGGREDGREGGWAPSVMARKRERASQSLCLAALCASHAPQLCVCVHVCVCPFVGHGRR